MKLKIFATILSIGAIVFGCKGNNDADVIVSANEITGTVKDGYRQLNMKVTGDPKLITVYRGDYIKFFLDDGGAPETDYQLDIPELEISTVIKDNTQDQPYFKMKSTGVFQFHVGERLGEIRVVELKQSNYSELSAEEAWQLLRKNPPLLLDVRTPEEYNRGYLKGARLIPLQELQKRAGEVEMYKNQPILIYCATGNRSTTAAKILLDMGFKDIKNMRLGIVGWAGKGYNIQFQ